MFVGSRKKMTKGIWNKIRQGNVNKIVFRAENGKILNLIRGQTIKLNNANLTD